MMAKKENRVPFGKLSKERQKEIRDRSERRKQKQHKQNREQLKNSMPWLLKSYDKKNGITPDPGDYDFKKKKEIDVNTDKEKYVVFLESRYWQEVRGVVLGRDNHKCQKCGSKENLRVHHLSYAHHHDEMNWLGDLITICEDCHAKEHKKKSPDTTTARTEKTCTLCGNRINKGDTYFKKVFNFSPISQNCSLYSEYVTIISCSRCGGISRNDAYSWWVNRNQPTMEESKNLTFFNILAIDFGK